MFIASISFNINTFYMLILTSSWFLTINATLCLGIKIKLSIYLILVIVDGKFSFQTDSVNN